MSFQLVLNLANLRCNIPLKSMDILPARTAGSGFFITLFA